MYSFRLARTLLAAVASVSLAAIPLGVLAADAPVHVGDQVYVNVYNHPELSGTHVVDSTGNIILVMAGIVHVAGDTPANAARRISARLRPYLPFAAVEVQRQSEGSSITIAGWPFPLNDGVAKYYPGQTLAGAIDAIRMTGQTPELVAQNAPPAFDPYHSQIDMRAVRVERDGALLGTYDMVALAAAGESGPQLRPGDAVLFHDKPIAVQVSGAVRQPGFAHLAPDEPLSDAIDQVYGLTDAARTAGIILRRNGTDTSISIADPAFREPAVNGDVLVVQTAPQVTVAGIVLHPGTVTLKSDVSLLAAVFSAGGPDKDGDLGHVHVVHDGVVEMYDVTLVARGDMSANPRLADGDQVYVPHGKRIDNTILASLASTLRWILFP
ncbi:MAG TPA: polysaccharide biosynthesis/export family protein [Candidatus Sulfotelmatobacter sp.]|nr:polysaccharide biosynthesis/export family protein [Candidatus Sulfotelmatobacter sp.]